MPGVYRLLFHSVQTACASWSANGLPSMLERLHTLDEQGGVFGLKARRLRDGDARFPSLVRSGSIAATARELGNAPRRGAGFLRPVSLKGESGGWKLPPRWQGSVRGGRSKRSFPFPCPVLEVSRSAVPLPRKGVAALIRDRGRRRHLWRSRLMPLRYFRDDGPRSEPQSGFDAYGRGPSGIAANATLPEFRLKPACSDGSPRR